MSNDNMVTITGNLVRDPELRFTQGGVAICSFGIAQNRRWQKNGEWEEKVSFFDCIAWGQFGENIAESVGKGDRAVLVGRLDQQTWEDKETGKNRSKVELVVESMGPDLRWATAAVTKNPRAEGGWAGREPDSNVAPTRGQRPSAPAEPGFDMGEEPF